MVFTLRPKLIGLLIAGAISLVSQAHGQSKAQAKAQGKGQTKASMEASARPLSEPFEIHCSEIGNSGSDRVAFSFFQYDNETVRAHTYRGGHQTFAVRTNSFVKKDGKRGTIYSFNLGLDQAYVSVRFNKKSNHAVGEFVQAPPNKTIALNCSRRKELVSVSGSRICNEALDSNQNLPALLEEQPQE